MILKNEDRIASGAYSDVFKPSHSLLVFKLFIGAQHPTNFSQGLNRPEDDTRRRKTFAAECEAYERAGLHPFLRNHIPGSFRRCVVEDVTESAGSVPDCYMLGHCYAMEYVQGIARKFGEFPIDYLTHHIKEAVEAFHEVGINHLIDSSVFSPDDPEKFRFIDFAIEEFQALW